MSELFTIVGENYFEIVLQDDKGKTVADLVYKGRNTRDAKREYDCFVVPEHHTYGCRGCLIYLDYLATTKDWESGLVK